MTGLLILAAIAVFVTLTIITLKSNAGVVALALMSGFVLNTYVGSEFALLVSKILPTNAVWATSIARLVCILLPALLVLWFLRKTASGSIAVLNIPLAILAGLVVILFSVPQLPFSAQSQLSSTTFWQYIREYQVAIVCVTLFVATVQFWLMRPASSDKHKKDKH